MPTMQRDAAVGESLLHRIADARQRSDALFAVVRPEALYDRPIPERHRMVFYIGHLEAFDWNLLHEGVFGLASFHSEYDRLFAFGIDPVGGGLPTDQPSDWPSLDRVREYVHRIRASLNEKLAGASSTDVYQRDGFSLDTLLNVAIEHRLMHVETLAYMLHQLPSERKISQAALPPAVIPAFKPAMLKVPAGVVTVGLPRHGGAFGWDNEFEAQRVDVRSFEIDRYMVTNGQFLGFIEDGGYESREFWIDADWQWKSTNKISSPVFWKKRADSWRYVTMFGDVSLPLDWPVYVSHAEASAYARWAGKTLPTEAQWQRAAYGSGDNVDKFYPWGNETPDLSRGNFDFYSWDPMPVTAHPSGQSAFGVEGMLGNGWEWTSTVFGPLPGFEPFPFYRGYSADFFDGKHYVIKGGSARTAACMLRPSFRNWFQSHYQYVYAGFRCVNE